MKGKRSNRFGRHFADCVRRDRPKPKDKWQIDEAVITIRGKRFWLWRAIDADGDVLDILVQARRNTKAAKRFFSRLVRQFGQPRVVVTDKLRTSSQYKTFHQMRIIEPIKA
ncbi:transposase-like protein [Ochrobactrum sp. AN78]|nr:transposase-like protein [Ochrobactrum sp. AN78]